ncbi:MAG: RraA family protein, partial [Saprospiraceae bacterium]|nr:RraA family protein [Saprospiraceae bacterium]
AIASEIGDACASLVKAESIILDYLKGGDVTTQGLVQAQAECSHQISLITNRNK